MNDNEEMENKYLINHKILDVIVLISGFLLLFSFFSFVSYSLPRPFQVLGFIIFINMIILFSLLVVVAKAILYFNEIIIRKSEDE